jgi:hypothetical protein
MEYSIVGPTTQTVLFVTSVAALVTAFEPIIYRIIFTHFFKVLF